MLLPCAQAQGRGKSSSLLAVPSLCFLALKVEERAVLSLLTPLPSLLAVPSLLDSVVCHYAASLRSRSRKEQFSLSSLLFPHSSPLPLPLRPSRGDSLDEVALENEKDKNDRQRRHKRGRHQAAKNDVYSACATAYESPFRVDMILRSGQGDRPGCVRCAPARKGRAGGLRSKPYLTQLRLSHARSMFCQIRCRPYRCRRFGEAWSRPKRRKRPGAHCAGPEKVSAFFFSSRKRISPSAS